MGDEYTSLYEQDTTSIKGGDFERFGAFADNHLDFIRALTKARGMDPISSDREIGAFLNTFDKLAAMPEPTPAKQEKDELSAGACDPADPLNLEQSSSSGNSFSRTFSKARKSSDCPCDAPALVDLWKHRLRSRYAESSAD